jgi:hypothetical protein
MRTQPGKRVEALTMKCGAYCYHDEVTIPCPGKATRWIQQPEWDDVYLCNTHYRIAEHVPVSLQDGGLFEIADDAFVMNLAAHPAHQRDGEEGAGS